MPPALPCPVGKRVEAATIVGEARPRKTALREHRQWRLLCDCGAAFVGDVSQISAGRVNRCAVCEKEALKARNWRHGCARQAREGRATKEYEIWSGMKRRCQNKKDKDYPRYGGRGIGLCERWQKFENFLADMGPRPSPDHTVEREDNDKGYGPDNCIWATLDVQAWNKRSTRWLTHDGVTLPLAEWARRQGR